jgi:predicted nucleotidyltransferase
VKLEKEKNAILLGNNMKFFSKFFSTKNNSYIYAVFSKQIHKKLKNLKILNIKQLFICYLVYSLFDLVLKKSKY